MQSLQKNFTEQRKWQVTNTHNQDEKQKHVLIVLMSHIKFKTRIIDYVGGGAR